MSPPFAPTFSEACHALPFLPFDFFCLPHLFSVAIAAGLFAQLLLRGLFSFVFDFLRLLWSFDAPPLTLFSIGISPPLTPLLAFLQPGPADPLFHNTSFSAIRIPREPPAVAAPYFLRPPLTPAGFFPFPHDLLIPPFSHKEIRCLSF